MAQTQRVGSLEIRQDLDFQRKEWRVQRIGWVVMALIALAALLGVTGSGMLARATVAEGPLQFEYSRFDRLDAPTTLEVLIDADAIAGDNVELRVDRTYFQSAQIQRILPEPEEVRGDGDGLTYVFGVAAPGQPVTITFDLRHSTFGQKSSWIALADEPPLNFSQVVYP
jgi:hypothetical protein